MAVIALISIFLIPTAVSSQDTELNTFVLGRSDGNPITALQNLFPTQSNFRFIISENSFMYGPAVAFAVIHKNWNSSGIPPQDIGGAVAQMIVGNNAVDNSAIWGQNIIVTTSSKLNNTKLNGIEIDMQPVDGTTLYDGNGLGIYSLGNTIIPKAIQISGNSGAGFGIGILLKNIANKGSGIVVDAGSQQMENAIDLSVGNYSISAIKVANVGSGDLFIARDHSSNIAFQVTGTGSPYGEGHLVTNMSGIGNAFVCVNSDGMLYRSVTACTSGGI